MPKAGVKLPDSAGSTYGEKRKPRGKSRAQLEPGAWRTPDKKKKSRGKQAKSGPKTTYGPPKGTAGKAPAAGGKKAPTSLSRIVAMINADKTLSESAKKGMIKSVRQHRSKTEAEG